MNVAIQNARQYEELQRTSNIVAARTAVAWMGMASAAWRHTIGNHATTIQEQTELLCKDLDAGKPVDFLKEGLHAIESLASDIRATPITAPLTTEEGVSSVFIHELLQERLQQWWKRGLHESVQLYWDLDSDASLMVRVSSEWLTRALDIIIENAIESMAESGERQLTVATRVFDKRVEIAISDTGRGVPSELKEHLFKGRRIPKPAGAKGSGVGLLMAQTILQTYGGDIRLGSTSPKGTTMVLWLPLEHTLAPPEVSVGAKRCLLVSAQRESPWYNVLQEVLASTATIIKSFVDEAISCITQEVYDLVLIDATGIEDIPTVIVLMLKQCSDAKIIVGAAAPNWQEARSVLRAGALDYIDKSTPRQALRNMFGHILDGYHDPFLSFM